MTWKLPFPRQKESEVDRLLSSSHGDSWKEDAPPSKGSDRRGITALNDREPWKKPPRCFLFKIFIWQIAAQLRAPFSIFNAWLNEGKSFDEIASKCSNGNSLDLHDIALADLLVYVLEL
jgi:hypothetical protein